MTGELEDPENAEHPERDKGARHVVVVRYPQPYVVGQYGHHVYNTHNTPNELVPVRRREQPQQILRGEYHHASSVQTEEHDLVPLPAGQGTGPPRPLPAGDRLDDVRHHRHRDEETRYVVENQGGGGSVRVLERPPHLLPDVGQLLQVLVAVLRELVVHQALGVLALPVAVVLVAAVADHVGEDAEEGELLVVAGQALVLRVVELAGAVVVEDVPRRYGELLAGCVVRIA